MASKKKKLKHKHLRNLRSAGMGAPRPRRSAATTEETEEEKKEREKKEQKDIKAQATYLAAGAAATAALGLGMAALDWQPKAIAGALALGGTGMTLFGRTPEQRAFGGGGMAAAGAQLALQMIDDWRLKSQLQKQKTEVAMKKPANANALPPGTVESAFERARVHMGLNADEFAGIGEEYAA